MFSLKSTELNSHCISFYNEYKKCNENNRILYNNSCNDKLLLYHRCLTHNISIAKDDKDTKDNTDKTDKTENKV